MPISAAKQLLYPKQWRYLRSHVLLRAGNRCEGSVYFPACRARNGEPHPETASIVCLTVILTTIPPIHLQQTFEHFAKDAI